MFATHFENYGDGGQYYNTHQWRRNNFSNFWNIGTQINNTEASRSHRIDMPSDIG
jgi:hypothetical protein